MKEKKNNRELLSEESDARQGSEDPTSNSDVLTREPGVLDHAQRTLKSVVSDLSFHGGLKPFTKSKIRIGYMWFANLIKRNFSFSEDPSRTFRLLLETYPYAYGTSLFLEGFLPFQSIDDRIAQVGIPHGVTVILGDSGSGKTELVEHSAQINSIVYAAEPQKSLYSSAHEAFSMLLIALLYSCLWEADYTSDIQKLLSGTGLVRRQEVNVDNASSVLERNRLLNAELVNLNESLFDVSHDDGEVFVDILAHHFPRLLKDRDLSNDDADLNRQGRRVAEELFSRVIPPHFFNAVSGKILAVDSMRDFLAGVGSDALTQGGISLRSVSDLTQFSQLLLNHQISLISTLNLNTKNPQIRDSMSHMVRSSVAGVLDLSVDPSNLSFRGVNKERFSVRGTARSPLGFFRSLERTISDDNDDTVVSNPAVDFFSLYPDFTL